MASPVEIAGPTITIDDAEKYISELSFQSHDEEPRVLILRPQSFVVPSAGQRLATHIASLPPLIVLLPQDSASDYWLLVQTGLGYSIARNATLHPDSGRDPLKFTLTYSRQRNVGSNSITYLDTHKGILDTSSLASFNTTFGSDVRNLNNISEQLWDVAGPESVPAVAQFCYEAALNIANHAFEHPFDGSRSPWSAFSITYRQQAFDLSDCPSSMHQYLEALNRLHDTRPSLLEVSVLDNGNGIATRHSLNSGLINGPIEDEAAALHDAFQYMHSVFPRIPTARRREIEGLGFERIRLALKKLHGYCSVRTGRLEAVLDTLNDPNAAFTIDGSPLDPIQGTSLTVLVPLSAHADTE